MRLGKSSNPSNSNFQNYANVVQDLDASMETIHMDKSGSNPKDNSENEQNMKHSLAAMPTYPKVSSNFSKNITNNHKKPRLSIFTLSILILLDRVPCHI